jgi:hypothetical protein
MGKLARAANLFFEISIEWDILVFCAVVDVAQLHFAERRADRGDIHAILIFQVTQFGDFGLGQLHHVLDAAADIDKPQTVVLQPQRRHRGELLDRGLMIGGLVAETGDHYLGTIWHIALPVAGAR